MPPAGKGSKHEPAIGTQRWLALVSEVRSTYCKKTCGEKCTNAYQGKCEMKSLTVKTIQNLENGSASPQTVNAVSPHLKINGFEYCEGFGLQQLHIEIPKVVDLRCEKSPTKQPDTFTKSRLMLSLDPLVISLKEGDAAFLEVKSMTVKLSLGELELKFIWIYEVDIYEGRDDHWLANDAEVAPFTLKCGETFTKSIMFNQTAFPPLAWGSFLELVKNTSSSSIQVELEVVCQYVIKRTRVLLAISQLKTFIAYGEEHLSRDPARLGPTALS